MGGERSEARDALRPAHLQPVVGAPSRVDVAGASPGAGDDPLRALLDERELTAVEMAEVVKTLERLVRHTADARLFARIAEAGFTGNEYDALTADLVAYAVPVLKAWLRRGRIFDECRAKGRPVWSGDRQRERMAVSSSDREELTGETIAEALKLFRDLAVDGRGWRPDGGTALTSYFIGTCVRTFPNVWRRWLSEQGDDLPVDNPGLLIDTTGRRLDIHTDPAEIVASRDLVRAALDAMPGSVREVAEPLVLHGSPLTEIAERLGTTAGAVEQRLRRYRTQQAKAHRGDTANRQGTNRQAGTNDNPITTTRTRSGDA